MVGGDASVEFVVVDGGEFTIAGGDESIVVDDGGGGGGKDVFVEGAVDVFVSGGGVTFVSGDNGVFGGTDKEVFGDGDVECIFVEGGECMSVVVVVVDGGANDGKEGGAPIAIESECIITVASNSRVCSICLSFNSFTYILVAINSSSIS